MDDGETGGTAAAADEKDVASSCASQSSRLSGTQAAALRDDGYVVVDGFLGAEVAAGLRAEAVAFASSGRIKEHRFQFGATQLTKPKIYEADLADAAMREELPELSEFYFGDALAESLADHVPELAVERGVASKTLKLQHNRGSGGCFPSHYDNAGRPNRRAVTCVVYLNPGWCEGDGGELVLDPFLGRELVIAPLMDRAVLFRSDRMLHRVHPAVAERFCFSIWLESPAANGEDECALKAKHLSTDEDNVAFLRRSPLQRAVSRAVYAAKYEESLLQCLQGTPGCAEMLAEHRRHVAQQMAHPQLGPFVEHLRSLRAGPEADGTPDSA